MMVSMIWEEVRECGWCQQTEYRPAFEILGKHYVRCAGCGLLRMYDRVAPQSLELVYGQYYGDFEAALSPAELATQLANPTFRFRRKRLEWCVPADQRRIFEIGCGDGNFLATLRQSGWQVDGCEYAPASVELVQRRHGIRVQTGDFSDLAIEPASLPVIAAYHVLEHVYEPRRWLQTVRERLKPGGILHLQLPNAGSLEARLSGAAWEGLIFPQHVYNYRLDFLKKGLQEAGFEILSQPTYDPWHSPGTTLATIRNLVRRGRGRPVWQLNQAEPVKMQAGPAQAASPTLVRRVVETGRESIADGLARVQSLIGAGNIIDIVARRR